MSEPLRSCGACQACCVVKEIPAVPSAAFEPCPQLSADGCACYAQRPEGCRRYTCAWVDGWGAPDDRPDRLGLVFEVAPGPFGGLAARAIELEPGAGDAPQARLRLEDWARLGASVRLQRHPTR